MHCEMEEVATFDDGLLRRWGFERVRSVYAGTLLPLTPLAAAEALGAPREDVQDDAAVGNLLQAASESLRAENLWTDMERVAWHREMLGGAFAE